MFSIVRYAVVLLLLSGCISQPQQANSSLLDESLLLHNIQLVDVEAGKLVQNKMVLIEQGKITAVLPATERSKYKNMQQLDGQSQYLIPALWDMHVHFEGRNLVEDNALLLPVYLAYGITAVRDSAGNLAPTVLEWRSEIAAGKRLGPRIFTAGQKFEGIDSLWDGDLEIGNQQDLLAGMEKLKQMQVDFIKITENTLQPELYLDTIREARRQGFLVSSHIPVGATIKQLAEAGLSSIEHASYLLRLGFADEAEIAAAVRNGTMTNADAYAHYKQGFDQHLAIYGYQMLARQQVAVTPTLIGGRQLAYLAETDHSKDQFLQYLTADFTDNYQWRIGRMAGETEAQTAERQQQYQLIAKQLPYLEQAGVLLLAGSDSAALNTYVYPAQALHDELELFQQAGLTPAQILRTATINGATFMGVQADYGSIAANKQADLLLLPANPLQDINAVRTIDTLIYGGKVYNRQALDKLLQQAAERKAELTLKRGRS
ncbi:amidohydrolase family protein [Rheinheimera salexigens]|uniref:Amidohydrolase-related domain-containing protein n=1 Tax=Rheinheimera salexigens TaxID=1628148 RepID=A0A1E7Q3B2_9GAMM|nr:amidohydrolase family protein [Rheinheimera salexigens]OEY68704.1 hypothetical protein BI198_03305 [Rheinheimera salexigens]